MSLLDSRWACSAGCLEAAALARLEHLCAIRIPAPQHRVPLGLLMLSRGYIDEQQLQTVLITQRDAGGGKLGSWALKLVRDRAPVAERFESAVVVSGPGPADPA